MRRIIEIQKTIKAVSFHIRHPRRRVQHQTQRGAMQWQATTSNCLNQSHQCKLTAGTVHKKYYRKMKMLQQNASVMRCAIRDALNVRIVFDVVMWLHVGGSHVQCDEPKRRKKSWKMGIGSGSPFDLEDKASWTSWMWIFLRIYRLSTSEQNKKREVWTQYSLPLSLIMSGYFSSFKNILRQREICKKSQAWR